MKRARAYNLSLSTLTASLSILFFFVNLFTLGQCQPTQPPLRGSNTSLILFSLILLFHAIYLFSLLSFAPRRVHSLPLADIPGGHSACSGSCACPFSVLSPPASALWNRCPRHSHPLLSSHFWSPRLSSFTLISLFVSPSSGRHLHSRGHGHSYPGT
jgi:hypothetical protein